jgi:hypothetical protein
MKSTAAPDEPGPGQAPDNLAGVVPDRCASADRRFDRTGADEDSAHTVLDADCFAQIDRANHAHRIAIGGWKMPRGSRADYAMYRRVIDPASFEQAGGFLPGEFDRHNVGPKPAGIGRDGRPDPGQDRHGPVRLPGGGRIERRPRHFSSMGGEDRNAVSCSPARARIMSRSTETLDSPSAIAWQNVMTMIIISGPHKVATRNSAPAPTSMGFSSSRDSRTPIRIFPDSDRFKWDRPVGRMECRAELCVIQDADP